MKLIIGFSTPTSFKIGAKIIQMFEHTHFSHVYLRVYTPFVSRNLVYQASHGYVNCLTYENFKSVNTVIAEFEYDVTDAKYIDTVRYCMDHLQLSYSRLGLLKIAVKKFLYIKGDGDKAFVCSELAARAIPEFYRGDPDLAEPIDLYNTLKDSKLVKQL